MGNVKTETEILARIAEVEPEARAVNSREPKDKSWIAGSFQGYLDGLNWALGKVPAAPHEETASWKAQDELRARELGVTLTQQQIVEIAYAVRMIIEPLAGSHGKLSFDEANCLTSVFYVARSFLRTVDPAYLDLHPEVVRFFTEKRELHKDNDRLYWEGVEEPVVMANAGDVVEGGQASPFKKPIEEWTEEEMAEDERTCQGIPARTYYNRYMEEKKARTYRIPARMADHLWGLDRRVCGDKHGRPSIGETVFDWERDRISDKELSWRLREFIKDLARYMFGGDWSLIPPEWEPSGTPRESWVLENKDVEWVEKPREDDGLPF